MTDKITEQLRTLQDAAENPSGEWAQFRSRPAPTVEPVAAEPVAFIWYSTDTPEDKRIAGAWMYDPRRDDFWLNAEVKAAHTIVPLYPASTISALVAERDAARKQLAAVTAERDRAQKACEPPHEA